MNALYNDCRDTFNFMTRPNATGNSLMKWKCELGRCNFCPEPLIPSVELSPNFPMVQILYGTYQSQIKCKVNELINSNSTVCQKYSNTISKQEMNCSEKIVKKKEVTLL